MAQAPECSSVPQAPRCIDVLACIPNQYSEAYGAAGTTAPTQRGVALARGPVLVEDRF
jgi:hypothetical protein